MARGQAVGAVVFAVLLTTAAVGPAVAYRPEAPEPGQGTGSGLGVGAGHVAGANSTVHSSQGHRIEALSALNESGLQDARKDRLLVQLRGTLREYEGANRTRRSPFATDRQLAAQTKKKAPSVTEHIVSSDATLARTAVEDARRARRVVAERNLSFDSKAVEKELSKAEKFLEKAEQKRDKSATAAINHYAKAWRRAQRVLSMLDAAVDPQVRITSRADPPRNGSTTVMVAGTVFDVRHHDVENVTVSLNGKDRTVRVSRSTRPASNSTFRTRLTLNATNGSVYVTAVDPGEPYVNRTEGNENSRGRGRAPAGGHDEQTGSDVLRLDGDGLPDWFEEKTGTDPLDSDSDGDGTIDGFEDFDDDGASAIVEYRHGTSPSNNDTDGDGLSDGLELTIPALDGTVADTDGDGTPDGAEDLDGDSLSNAEEVSLGTSPVDPDTDRDGLDDGQERELGTDPTTWDTDGDGLRDGVEPTQPFGTDPTNPDSDGDGVLDGNETFTSTATHDETGVEVSITGPGNVAGSVRLFNRTSYFDASDVVAGPTVRVVNRTDFDNATVEIPISSSVTKSEYDDLAIYKWNGSADDEWTRVNTTIRNGTASATVESFSYFTVLDTDEWVDLSTRNISRNAQLRFNNTSVACQGACTVDDNSTLVLGGEPETQKIVVEQGNETYEVVPLSNGQKITTFYDYANWQINSPLPIATSDMSRLFLWSGPEGLSLVVLHDEANDGSGGAVTMTFDGLPTDEGNWVVKDDPNDQNSSTRFDWGWVDTKTDGGAFRGGLTNQTITIHPRFNEAASRDASDLGQIQGWQLLTGRATEPDTRSLDMDEPVTIHVPSDPSENESGGLQGDAGNGTLTTNLTGVEALSVAYQTEQTDVNPSTSVVVTGANGTTVKMSPSIGTVGTVQETMDVSNVTGEATVRVAVDGVNFRAQFLKNLTSLDTWPDSDGDGIPDRIETQEWTMDRGPAQTFQLDPNDPDTDDDGIPDGEEVSFTLRENGTVTLDATSNPARADTDGDGLSDAVERRGWNVSVVNRSGYEKPYAWAGTKADVSGSTGAMHFDSSPLRIDTDGDGLSDGEEKSATHTDPRAVKTYGLTTDHEETLREELAEMDMTDQIWVVRSLGLQREDIEFVPYSPELTDASDDFDLVLDSGESGVDRFTILRLAGEQRTDYWLSNRHELNDFDVPISERTGRAYDYVRTGPWVSDTDGDGLTDGQEVRKTEVTRNGASKVYQTNMTDRDTDGDELPDLAEFRFGANPQNANTDGDQFEDFRDPMVRTENFPPKATITGLDEQGVVTIGVTDSSGIERVEVIYIKDNEVNPRDRYGRGPEGESKTFSMDAPVPAQATKMIVKAFDVHGNGYKAVVNLTPEKGDKLEAIGAIAPVVFTPSPEDWALLSITGTGLVAGIVLAATSVIAVATLQLVDLEGRTTESLERDLYPTPSIESYGSAKTVLNEKVYLQQGFVETANRFERGYGWRYIDATTDVTQSAIEDVLKNGRKVTDGDVTYVIGDGLSDEEKIILTIIGGLVVAASSSTVEDECGAIVNVNKNGEHATRDGKPVDKVSTLRELIRNEVVKIVDVAGKRYYIAKFGGGYVLVSSQGNPGYWIVKTILTSDSASNLFSTVRDAMKNIPGKDGEKDVVYDSESGVDC